MGRTIPRFACGCGNWPKPARALALSACPSGFAAQAGGEWEARAPDLPGSRVDRAAHGPSNAGEASAGRATAREPGECAMA
jgi:hypothetical protein